MSKECDYPWLDRVTQCLYSTEFGCLATQGENGPWASPVYIAWDESWNFYFISELNTQHMRNIEEQNSIAISIYDSRQSTHKDVLGLQIKGCARILKDEREKHNAFKWYFGRVYPSLKPIYGDPIDNPYAYDKNWHYVKTVPENIYLFDTAYFGDRRTEVPQKELIA